MFVRIYAFCFILSLFASKAFLLNHNNNDTTTKIAKLTPSVEEIQEDTRKVYENLNSFIKKINAESYFKDKYSMNKLSSSMASRRFVPWFNFLTTTTSRPVLSTEPTPDVQLAILFERLTEAVVNLTEILRKLNSNIEVQIQMNPLSVIPLNNNVRKGPTRRIKREIPGNSSDVVVANITNNVTATEASTTQAPHNIEVNACITNKTRRTEYSNPEIKLKLLKYFNDSFQEMESKLKAIQNVKTAYEENSVFQIGYIVANIDNLEVTSKNLKKHLEANKEEWDEKKIIDTFDKLTTNNRLVTSLIGSLFAIANKS